MEQQSYWEAPIVNDPWGQPYRCDSSRVQYRVWSVGPDAVDGTDDDEISAGVAPQRRGVASQSEEQRPNVVPKRSPEAGRVGNTLTVTKSGDDVVLSWGATGTTYDVVGSTTAGFLNPYVLNRQASTTYTYVDALSGAGDLEFFDVTDETETNRFQNLYAGYGTIAGAGGSRRIATDPPANMANCINLGGSGSIQVLGAAPDPNPDGLGGRDVVYFAFKDAGAGTEYIKKVNVTAGGCSGIADNDYGNRGGVWDWDFQVGMSVDEATGDLYVPEKTKISVVATNETVSTFKTGFSRLFGVDVWHEPGGSFGAVLAADFSSGAVSAVPLDNPAAASAIAGGTALRTVTWSRSSYSTAAWVSVLMNRMTLAHNTGGNVALLPAPGLKAEPYEGTAHVWISAPDPDDKADSYQGDVRPSYNPSPSDFSTFKVKAWWDDGVARDICAMLGDAPTTADYQPKPTLDACWLPWEDPQTGTPNGSCDNQEPFDGSAGVGTSVDTNTFKECESGCGASWADACEFEFRITQRYAGDNYRVYFFQPSGKGIVMSALVTAWKRAYIENDAMCREGALLNEDALNGQDLIYIAFHPDGSVPPDPSVGETIHIFDADHPMTGDHDLACVRQRTVETPENRVRIDLGEVGNCSQPYTLQVSDQYDADDNEGPDDPWDFDSGSSAGVCVDGSDFYTADSSQLNTRSRTGPFDDAFVHFAMPPDGAGILPYFPELDFNGDVKTVAALRFHQIWFDHKRPFSCDVGEEECDNCCNEEQNYFHLMGLASRETGDWGKTRFQSDASFSFSQAIEDFCTGCSPTELANALQRNANHEIAHQFEVNCPNPTPPPSHYHNLNDAWCGVCDGGYLPWCLMHVDSEPLANRIDGVDRFCCYNLLADPVLCSSDVTQCGEGLRVTTDPK